MGGKGRSWAARLALYIFATAVCTLPSTSLVPYSPLFSLLPPPTEGEREGGRGEVMQIFLLSIHVYVVSVFFMHLCATRIGYLSFYEHNSTHFVDGTVF